MIDLSKVHIDTALLSGIYEQCQKYEHFNFGCEMHDIWKREGYGIVRGLLDREGDFCSDHWLGNGFPQETKLWCPLLDVVDFQHRLPNWDTLDIQSAVYQFYQIVNLMRPSYWPHPMRILDIGGGYGRLAIPFLEELGHSVHYVCMDYVPISLLAAPQVIRQLFPKAQVLGLGNIYASELTDYNFVSLPAWGENLLKDGYYDAVVNIHSFQEMKLESISFYAGVAHRVLRPGGIFYTINNYGLATQDIAWAFDTIFGHQMEEAVEYPLAQAGDCTSGIPTGEWTYRKED